MRKGSEHMSGTIIFAKRNVKELLRDPLSYFLCLGFPIAMLIIMTIVDRSIPPEAHMTLFKITNLYGGIAVFGQSFLMIFTGLIISKDRSGAFLRRLYASPMKPAEYISGYTLPVMAIAVGQEIITALCSVIIGLITGYTFNIPRLLLSMIILIPSAAVFISLGLLFGSIFSEKAAPGLCSIIISLSCFMGGIWIDIDSIGGVFAKICKYLPFYHAVRAARCVVSGSYDGLFSSLIITVIYAAAIFSAAAFSFGKKMRSDTN